MDENTVRRRSIAIPRLQPVETDADIERLAKLAHEIWFEYWPAHIGEAQTRYMVERFQTAEAIRRDMASSAYEYWFVLAPDDGRVVGYTGGHAEPKTGRFFISKIYLRACERGRHFASGVIAFYEDLCRERGLRAMYLTVNKGNVLGIRDTRATALRSSTPSRPTLARALLWTITLWRSAWTRARWGGDLRARLTRVCDAIDCWQHRLLPSLLRRVPRVS